EEANGQQEDQQPDDPRDEQWQPVETGRYRGADHGVSDRASPDHGHHGSPHSAQSGWVRSQAVAARTTGSRSIPVVAQAGATTSSGTSGSRETRPSRSAP